MNPRKWKREHRVAWGIITILGALVGPLVGYGLGAIAGYDGDFLGWFFDRDSEGPLWILFGACFAALVFYLVRLLKA